MHCRSRRKANEVAGMQQIALPFFSDPMCPRGYSQETTVLIDASGVGASLRLRKDQVEGPRRGSGPSLA
jgi:hypothetical protein